MSHKKQVVIPTLINLPRLLNIQEAAHVLRVSVRTIHTIIKDRQLTHIRVRGQLRFEPSHLNEYLQKRMVLAA